MSILINHKQIINEADTCISISLLISWIGLIPYSKALTKMPFEVSKPTCYLIREEFFIIHFFTTLQIHSNQSRLEKDVS